MIYANPIPKVVDDIILFRNWYENQVLAASVIGS